MAPVKDGFPHDAAHFGTAVGVIVTEPINTAAMKRYEKLKNAAKALLLAGDVDRYLQALRLMHGLRAMNPSGLA